MSRSVFLSLEPGKVVDHCRKADIGISAIEGQPSGGARLVCMSSAGAEQIRKLLKSHVLGEEKVTRQRYRPSTPLW